MHVSSARQLKLAGRGGIRHCMDCISTPAVIQSQLSDHNGFCMHLHLALTWFIKSNRTESQCCIAISGLKPYCMFEIPDLARGVQPIECGATNCVYSDIGNFIIQIKPYVAIIAGVMQTP